MENVNSNNVNNNVNNNNEPKKKGNRLGRRILFGVGAVAAVIGGAALDKKCNNGELGKALGNFGKVAWKEIKNLLNKKNLTVGEKPVQPQYQRRDFNNGQRFDRHHGGNGNKPAMNINNNQQ